MNDKNKKGFVFGIILVIIGLILIGVGIALKYDVLNF